MRALLLVDANIPVYSSYFLTVSFLSQTSDFFFLFRRKGDYLAANVRFCPFSFLVLEKGSKRIGKNPRLLSVSKRSNHVLTSKNWMELGFWAFLQWILPKVCANDFIEMIIFIFYQFCTFRVLKESTIMLEYLINILVTIFPPVQVNALGFLTVHAKGYAKLSIAVSRCKF